MLDADELMLNTLERIEKNQKLHDDKMDELTVNIAGITTKQDIFIEVQEDHESRIRKNETILVKVTVFFSGASMLIGSAIAWAVDKLLSIAN